MKRLTKKGYALKDILTVAILFLVTVIGLSVGSQIVANIADDQCAAGYSYNASMDRCENATGAFNTGAGMTYASNTSEAGLQGLSEFGSWMPTLALIFSAAIIIGVLVTASRT